MPIKVAAPAWQIMEIYVPYDPWDPWKQVMDAYRRRMAANGEAVSQAPRTLYQRTVAQAELPFC
jgi:hypothetical protein